MALARFGLISDTHGHLHRDVFEVFKGVEMILHAGDVCGDDVLDELELIAPTLAVQGNCDYPGPRLPVLRVIEFPFGVLCLSHSHLVPGDGPGRLARHFASQRARVVVYGHTHQAYCAEHDGTWVVNPGPAGKPRLRDEPSVTVMTWDDETGALAFEMHRVSW